MSVRRRVTALTSLIGLVVTPLALVAGPAQAAGSGGLVISEVFGANSATVAYNQDYVEILNPTSGPLSLAGKSVQYRAAGSTSASSRVDLPAIMLPAGAHFLVGGASTSSPTTAATISPDASNGSMNLSGTAGVVVLANAQTNLSLPAASDPATFNPAVIDLVGYGSTPTLYETTRAPAPTTTGTPPKPVLNRAGGGATDTDNNGVDFTTAATGSPSPCDCIAPDGFKITEVYADGGQPGSTYDHDFVEIQNVSGTTLSMSGLTLQYRAPGATGPATVVATLTGSMANNSFDLVQLAGATGNGAALASPRYTGSLDLQRAGGTLLLAKSTTAYDPGTGNAGGGQFVSDLVGWGSSNTFETAAADGNNLDATHSIQRANGAVDSGDNSADLDAYAPSPNSQPAIPVRTIPEIQGTGGATPLNGANVATSGVVTAAYSNATGGFNGFYLQTAGYDPANDATPGASDGIFVYTGSSTTFPTPSVGQFVTLSSAKVSEFAKMTELTMTNPANLVVRPATAAEAVVPGTVVPGTDCTITGSTTDCLTGAALEAAREAHEGELYLPTAPYTVSDSYDGSPWSQSGSAGFAMKGEIGLAANDDEPLFAPTEVANPATDPEGLAARNDYNDAHMITLDDGNNVDYSSTTGTAFPWLTGPDHTVRIGAPVTFTKPVVLDFRNDLWKLQPQTKVAGGTDGSAQGIDIAQDRPAAPQPVGGNVRIATFNMLNYFVDDAETWVAQGGDAYGGTDRTCTYYTDRNGSGGSAAGNPGRVTANTCTWTDARGVVAPATPVKDGGAGPRGAAQKCSCTDLTSPFGDFERQQAKEVRAINAMDADVMSLEEVENAIKLGYADRDRAVSHLVEVLNADWDARHPGDTGTTPRWAYAATPRAEAQPTIAEQDAIRSAFIYNPRVVETVGRSEILVNSAPFRNAREPLAQAFKRVGGNRDDGFIVIVNHFKSKGDSSGTASGDNVDLGDGAGSYNGDRVRQARALDAFAQAVSEDKGIPAVLMTGDYNAYSQEDPILTLERAGWHELAPDNHEKSYAFGGLMGSLDHVFANDAALGMVSGKTVWPINANEPVFYEYSRYNYNLTNLYDGTTPFRASDHNPEIIGIDAPLNPPPADLDTVQVLASNDFHGRILDDPGSAAAGAASMADAVKGLRADNPNTLFAMAGDIIGASTFESFIAKDKPTLDAMNEAGLDVSSAGNHEFDQGYHDLVNRVMEPYDAQTNPTGGANWPYLAANVRLRSDDSYALASDRTDHGYDHSDGATWWKQLSDGHTVGFVGAVTEDLPSLVAPSALQDVYITSIVDEVNSAADRLKATGCGGDGCDLVIELVHEGAATPAYSSVTDGSAFAKIVAGADANVDAIVSGHTHLKYNHKVPVQSWIDQGRAVTERPVVSAGQYGSYLNQLEFDFAPGTDHLVDIRQHVLAMKDYDADAPTQAIVDAAVANAEAKGAQSLGQITGPFQRARRQDPTTSSVVENRGGESTPGNEIAEIQRWKTGAQIGFMNPGGLRADMLGRTPGTYPSELTYRQAADVQPFANELMTLDLTGAQIKTLLEQQWQRDPDGNVPSRPFLRLGTSKGFQLAYDAGRPEGDRITGMWLDGEPLDAGATYHVSATNFLVSGGDNFRALTGGTHQQDTGFTDLQAVVDYLAAHPTASPDFAQHAVGVSIVGDVPSAGFSAGDTVTVDVSSLAMTGDQVQPDTQDSTVRVYDGADPLGAPATVNNTLRALPDDEAGSARVTFTLPAVLEGPTATYLLKGDHTGTSFPIRVPVKDTFARTSLSATADPSTVEVGDAVTVSATLTGATPAAGRTVTFEVEGTSLSATTDADGVASVQLAPFALAGTRTVTVGYAGSSDTKPSSTSVTVTVERRRARVSGTDRSAAYGEAVDVPFEVTPSDATGLVTLLDGDAVLGSAPVGADHVGLAARALEVGSHVLTLSYAGDDATTPATGTVTVTVTKAVPTVTTTASPATIQVGGDTSTVTVTVAAAGLTPTGTVTCTSESGSTTATLSGGTATCQVGPFATKGTRTVAVGYSGDEHTGPGNATQAIDVAGIPTQTQAGALPMMYGFPGVVLARVTSSGTPTGTVGLYEGTTLVSSGRVGSDGVALVVIGGTSLTPGAHDLVARYSGDDRSQPSQAPVQVTVAKALSAVTVALNPTSVAVGQATTVAGSVTAFGFVPTGSVDVLVDGTRVATAPLTNGAFTASTGAFTSQGDHDVTVVYSGDATTLRSQAATSIKVTKKAR